MSIDWKAQRAAIENEVENVLPYRKKNTLFSKSLTDLIQVILLLNFANLSKMFSRLRINHKQEAVHSFLGIIENST